MPTGAPTTGAPAPIDPATGQPVTGVAATQPAATIPANQLPTWTQWQQAFQGLGAGPEQIAMIGATPLTENQLALTYMSIAQQLQELAGTGQTPGTDPANPNAPVDPTQPQNPQQPGTGASAWTPEIEQAFAALGLKPEELAMLKQKADAEGADMATLSSWYEELAAVKNGQNPGATGENTPPGKPAQWTPEIEQQLKDLGAPQPVIDSYKQAAAQTTEEGLQQGIASLAERKAAFDKSGKADDLKKLGVTEEQMWQNFILPVKQPTAGEIDEQITSLKWQGFDPLGGVASVLPGPVGSMASTAGKYGGQALLQALPFVGIYEAIRGKSIHTDQPISLTDPGDLALLGLSVAGTYGAIRGMRHIANTMQAIGKAGQGMSEARAVAGLAAETGAVGQAQLGVLSSTGGKVNWLKMLNPFNGQYRQEVASLGMIENASKFVRANESEILAKGAQGELMLSSFRGMVRDVLTGQVTAQTSKGVFGTPWSFLTGFMPRAGKSAPQAGSYLPAGIADVSVKSRGLLGMGGAGSTGMLSRVSSGGAAGAGAADGVLGTMTLSHTLRPGNGAAAFEAILAAAGDRLGYDALEMRKYVGAGGKLTTMSEPLKRLEWLLGDGQRHGELIDLAKQLAKTSDASVATFASDLSGAAASMYSPGAIPGIRRGAHNYLQDAATAVERQRVIDPSTGDVVAHGNALMDNIAPALGGYRGGAGTSAAAAASTAATGGAHVPAGAPVPTPTVPTVPTAPGTAAGGATTATLGMPHPTGTASTGSAAPVAAAPLPTGPSPAAGAPGPRINPEADELIDSAESVAAQAAAYGVDMSHLTDPAVHSAVRAQPTRLEAQAVLELEEVLVARGRAAIVDAGRTLYSNPLERMEMYAKYLN